MDIFGFVHISYLVVVIILLALSAVLMMNSPLANTLQNRNVIAYFATFFILSTLGVISILLRPTFNTELSILLTNSLFLINFYNLRFGLMWRLGSKQLLHRQPWVFAHVVIFVSCQLSSYVWLPDSHWFRVANGALNSILVLVGCLPLVYKNKTSIAYGEKIAHFALLSLILLFALLPVIYLLNEGSTGYQVIQAVIAVIGIFVLVNGLQCLLMSDVIEQHYQTSIKDPLTSIFNRRYFFQAIKNLASHASNTKVNSVILCDIDKFKSINDKFGHDVGDIVLKRFAVLLKEIVGDYGIVSRYGGEEFTILLKEHNLPQAITFAERLRLQTELLVFAELPNNKGITASFGVAEVWDLEDIDLALKLADDALLTAKGAGRNKVCAN